MRAKIQDQDMFRQTFNQVCPELDLPQLNGITIDSRMVERGDIFLAMQGENTDGHSYIKQAQDAGAAACIVEKEGDVYSSVVEVSSTRDFLYHAAEVYRDSLNCPVIGITGSNGKTTTKDLLDHVLSSNRTVMSTRGNFNSTIGVPLSIFECGKNVDIAIIEMGASKPGEIEYICSIAKPDMGIITNIFESHIEFFGSIETVADTKSALFSTLPESGTAFVNMDDIYIPEMDIPCKRVEYSFSRTADFQGRWYPEEQILVVNGTSIKLSAHSYALGLNALAVFAIASHLGMDSALIKKHIESFHTPSGRGDVISLRDFVIINDSYNANLESARSGINNLISMPGKRRKIAVIGDMLELGEMDKDHHHSLGKHLSEKKVDAVFAYGDLTRHTISAMNGASVFHQFYEDKNSLLSDLKEFLIEGDIIYVKGSRGMKMEEIIQGLQD